MLSTSQITKLGLAWIKGSLSPNLLKIPSNQLKPTIDNAVLFNRIYQDVIHNPSMTRFKRTQSNGISNRHLVYPAYDLEILKTANGGFKGVELVVLSFGYMFKISFTSKPIVKVSGHRAYVKLREILKKRGVDLADYELNKEEARRFKKMIPMPLIKVANPRFTDVTFDNVHHIDFHSSYAAGLANCYPEFRDTLEFIYEKRNYDEVYKSILNCSIGYFQSPYLGYKLSNLAYAANQDNVDRVTELARRVNARPDNVVLLYNTDGFWYKGPEYHGEGEGAGLGDWHNDHVNCKLRIKSAGAYEYVEDGKYHVVLRGATLYDKIKDREDWEWGDIYRTDSYPVLFSWNDREGILIEK